MALDFTKSKASVLLDLVRALAAILVLVEHWRNIFFVDFSEIPVHRVLLELPYLLSSAGHQAVVIFFVLSGYLISGSIFRTLKRNQWSWRTYLLHRALRLWIVLIPGLILCALWDEIGLRSKLAPLLYAGTSGDHMVPAVAAAHTVGIFLGNIAFLQMIFVPTFGSDSALWSLAYEFWYYILFPLVLFVILPRVSWRVRIACVVLCGAVAALVSKEILLYFPIWLSGTLLALMPAPRLSNGVRIAAAAVYTPIFFAFTKMDALHGALSHISIVYRDYALTIATVLFLWILLSASAPSRHSKSEKLVRETSRFSYTLYVVHTPLCILMAALLVGDRRWDPDLPHALLGLLCLAVLVGYAFGVASITEFKTDVVRRWLEKKMGLGMSRPQIVAKEAKSNS